MRSEGTFLADFMYHVVNFCEWSRIVFRVSWKLLNDLEIMVYCFVCIQLPNLNYDFVKSS